MNTSSTKSHLESDERNTAGFDFCNAHAPAEAVQLSVGLEGCLGQGSVLGAVEMYDESINSPRWQKEGNALKT